MMPLGRAKRPHTTIANCARISTRRATHNGQDRQHPADPESPNTRSACWSVRLRAHRDRCGTGPSESHEACRKGPMHAPVSTPMHVHSWQSREATRAWRPWGERNVRPPHSVSMQPCVGFKQHSNNYNRRVSLMTVGETDRRGDLVEELVVGAGRGYLCGVPESKDAPLPRVVEL